MGMTNTEVNNNLSHFSSGAVRDTQTGKGRFDLMPLDVIGDLMMRSVYSSLSKYQQTKNIDYIFMAIEDFLSEDDLISPYEFILELAKHFEKGAEKYGEYNWQKGIPINRYIDSGARHLTKHYAGHRDESHEIAFLWNMICLIWEHRQHRTVE